MSDLPTPRVNPADPQQRFMTAHRVFWWVLTGAAVGVVAVAGIESTWGWLALVAAGALAIAQVVRSDHARWKVGQQALTAEGAAVEAAARLRVTLADALTPIVAVLGRLAHSRGHERIELAGQLKAMVLEAAAEISAADRTRATFFRKDRTRLVPVLTVGRADSPVTVFERDDSARGDQAHELVARHEILHVRDMDAPPAGLDVNPGARYRSFVSAAVYAGPVDYGLLSVDSLDVESFSDGDDELVRTLALLLAVGLSIELGGEDGADRDA